MPQGIFIPKDGAVGVGWSGNPNLSFKKQKTFNSSCWAIAWWPPLFLCGLLSYPTAHRGPSIHGHSPWVLACLHELIYEVLMATVLPPLWGRASGPAPTTQEPRLYRSPGFGFLLSSTLAVSVETTWMSTGPSNRHLWGQKLQLCTDRQGDVRAVGSFWS